MLGVTRDDDVVVLELQREERRNALNLELCQEIHAAVDAAVAEGARSIVVTGQGSVFCSGADLGGVYGPEFLEALYGMLHHLTRVPVPIIAAVNGPAIGAGTQLAMACDLRVADETARFAVPTAKNGMAVDAWTIRTLAQLAGAGPRTSPDAGRRDPRPRRSARLRPGRPGRHARRRHGLGPRDRDPRPALARPQQAHPERVRRRCRMRRRRSGRSGRARTSAKQPRPARRSVRRCSRVADRASLGFDLLDRHVVDGRGDDIACSDATGTLTFAQLLERVGGLGRRTSGARRRGRRRGGGGRVAGQPSGSGRLRVRPARRRARRHRGRAHHRGVRRCHGALVRRAARPGARREGRPDRPGAVTGDRPAGLPRPGEPTFGIVVDALL